MWFEPSVFTVSGLTQHWKCALGRCSDRAQGLGNIIGVSPSLCLQRSDKQIDEEWNIAAHAKLAHIIGVQLDRDLWRMASEQRVAASFDHVYPLAEKILFIR